MAATIDRATGQPVIDIVLPTFRMEPEEDERFYPSQAKAVAEAIMKEELDGMTYDEEESKNWGLNISDKVRETIQGLCVLELYDMLIYSVSHSFTHICCSFTQYS